MERVYVGNLPPDIRIKDIDDFFRPFGKLVYIDVNHQANPVYAFVQFDSPRNAFNAVKSRHGYDYEGYTLQLRLVENEVRKRRDASPPPQPPSFNDNNRGSGYSQSSFGNSNNNRRGGNHPSSTITTSSYQSNSNSPWLGSNRSQENLMNYQNNNVSNMLQQNNMQSYSSRSNMPQQFNNSNRSNMSQQNMNYSGSSRSNISQQNIDYSGSNRSDVTHQNMDYSGRNRSNMSQSNLNISNTNRSNMPQQQQNMNSRNYSNNSSWNGGNNNNMGNWNNGNNNNMGNWSSGNNSNMSNWNSGNDNMANWSSGNNDMGNWNSGNNMGNWSNANNNMGWNSNNPTTSFSGDTSFGRDNFNNNNPAPNFIYNANNDPYANKAFEDNFTRGLSNNGRKWFNRYIRKGFSPRVARNKAMDHKREPYPRDDTAAAIMPDPNDPTNAALETIGNTILSLLSSNPADNFNNSNQLVPWTGGNSQADMRREKPPNHVSKSNYYKSKRIVNSLLRKQKDNRLTEKDKLSKKYHLQIIKDFEDFEKKERTAALSSTKTTITKSEARNVATTSVKSIEQMAQKYRQKKKKLLLEGRRMEDKSRLKGPAYRKRVRNLIMEHGFLVVEAKALATHPSEKLNDLLELKAACDKAEGRVKPVVAQGVRPKQPKYNEDMYYSDVDYVKSYEQYNVNNLSGRIKRNISFYLHRMHQYEKDHNLRLTKSKYTKLLPPPTPPGTVSKNVERKKRKTKAKKATAKAAAVSEKIDDKANTKEEKAKKVAADNVDAEAKQKNAEKNDKDENNEGENNEDDHNEEENNEDENNEDENNEDENNEDITEEHEEEYEDADENHEEE